MSACPGSRKPMRHGLTQQQLQDAQMAASKKHDRFTECGTQVNTPWLTEYVKVCKRIKEQMNESSTDNNPAFRW